MTTAHDTRPSLPVPAAGLRRALTRPDDPAGRIRPEIQALRAVAVVAVVVYHFFPGRVPGGYVGVDVFFVISGYLIIGHILREVETTGRVRLVDFWARRARRLIPASALTLIATAVAIVIWVPEVYWTQFLDELGAAALYVVNWALAASSIDYLGAQNAPSPVQHFWSLSVEEQFYIAWPILIVLTLVAVRVFGWTDRRRVMLILLVVVTVASAAYSVWATRESQASAYFFTTTRAWEFSAGGVLAAVGSRLRMPRGDLASLVSWLGLGLIAVALFAYSDATAFPGYAAALPVAGALLFIAAGLPTGRLSPAPLIRLRPVQWLGDTSYSLYLWHWPIVVIAPLALGHPLGTPAKLLLLLAALAVGWASMVLVEDPVRRSPRLLRRGPWFAVAATIIVAALISGSAFAASAAIRAHAEQARADALALIDSGAACIGAAAFGPGRDCPRPFAVTDLTDPATAAQDIGSGVRVVDQCKQTPEDSRVLTCEIGDTDAPTLHVALVGDSHAGQFLEPMDRYGRDNGWQVTTYLKTWCQGTGAAGVAAPDNAQPANITSCSDWGDAALSQIAADPSIDVVLFANFTNQYTQPTATGRPIVPADFEAAWQRMLDADKRVVVLRDPPNADAIVPAQCIAQQLDVYDPCTTPRSAALAADDPQWAAVQAMPEVSGVDLTANFCDDVTCHTLIGGLIVYFDSNHLTASYARTLAPYLGGAIADAVG